MPGDHIEPITGYMVTGNTNNLPRLSPGVLILAPGCSVQDPISGSPAIDSALRKWITVTCTLKPVTYF